MYRRFDVESAQLDAGLNKRPSATQLLAFEAPISAPLVVTILRLGGALTC